MRVLYEKQDACAEKTAGEMPGAYYTAPNQTEPSEKNIKKASEESRRLAQTAVEKLIENTISLSTDEITDWPDKYEWLYLLVCSFAPEIPKLERRADGALALLELYEEYAEKAKTYDWLAMKQRQPVCIIVTLMPGTVSQPPIIDGLIRLLLKMPI